MSQVLTPPSRLLRTELKARFAASFNSNLAAACAQFGIAGLVFELNFAQIVTDGALQNYFEGHRSLDSLMAHHEPDFPALAWWVGEGQDQTREKPKYFSGTVFAYWRFFLSVEGLRTAGLIDLQDAVQASMILTLAPELGGLGYRGDLGWHASEEQRWVDQDENHRGYIQQVDFHAGFEVNV